VSDIVRECITAFRDRFGGDPKVVVRAPGRVNLIGEHTDYNDGFVFPAAIDRYVVFAARPRSDNRAVIWSVSFNEDTEFTFNRGMTAEGHWSDYIKGMMSEFQSSNLRMSGFEATIAGNVPLGAGLSSSAAVEMAVGRGLLELFDISMPGPKLATVGQAAENNFVGVNCGIMDQFVSANGREGHALYLDCRDLSFELVPISDEDLRIVICNSGVKRGLTDSAYNERRKACEDGVRQLALATGESFSSLRDVTLEHLEDYSGALTEEIFERCRHVITEIERTGAAVDALKAGAIDTFGELMGESHRSLKDDYEVSGPELDKLVDIAGNVDGVIGARMTGAGFGGCVVCIANTDAVTDLVDAVDQQYTAQTEYSAEVYTCSPVNGVERID
jgi:galactokinase